MNSLASKINIINREKLTDNRGWFLKLMTGYEDYLPKETGEIYMVQSVNGASRGGHFHKIASEWFTIIQGESNLKLSDIESGETMTIKLSFENPKTIFVPPNIAHRFDSIDNNSFTLIAYSSHKYDENDTINMSF